jgi:hypothetical protein
METSLTINKTETKFMDNTEKQGIIENHNVAASHLLAAATHHFKAANYLKLGSYEKAAQSAILAQEYLNLASEAKKDDAKQSTVNNIIAI